jgi:hypothetical protein
MQGRGTGRLLPRRQKDIHEESYPQISQIDADFLNFKSAKSASSADPLPFLVSSCLCGENLPRRDRSRESGINVEGRLLSRRHTDIHEESYPQISQIDADFFEFQIGEICVICGFLALSCFAWCLGAFVVELFLVRVGLSTLDSRLAFEGAHLIRRCSPCCKSAHLGKARSFLRRCAPFSKVRTEKCASTTPSNAWICPPCCLRGLLCARGGRL